jgi:hypothetical protein
VLDENCQHTRIIRLWRSEFGHAPPFDIGPDTLFVAYSAWAEMTCFKVLGWEFPKHIFDRQIVQDKLAANRHERSLAVSAEAPSLLAMLRLATVRLCEAGIVPIMLIHDGILFEEAEAGKIEQAIEIMRGAGRDVGDGFEVGVDLDKRIGGGDRYRDDRPMAKKMWATVMDTIAAIGAAPALKDIA